MKNMHYIKSISPLLVANFTENTEATAMTTALFSTRKCSNVKLFGLFCFFLS